MSATVIIHSASLVSGGVLTLDAWVAFEGDLVSAVGTGDGWRTHITESTQVIDAAGRWLTPGFIDIHCHGAGGFAFDDGAEAIRTAMAVHHAHGSTRIVLSLVTASVDDLEIRLDAIATEADQNPLILGAHLEGPFLDNDFRGAHDPALLRAPDADSIARLLRAGRGHIRQVTLAPELTGAPAAIAALTDAGVAVAVGHSSTDYELPPDRCHTYEIKRRQVTRYIYRCPCADSDFPFSPSGRPVRLISPPNP